MGGRRLLLLAVRMGVCACWVGVMDGCPMLLTRPSSRLWKPLAALLLLWTEPMRCRAPSRAVLRSSSVRVRGRLLSPLTPRTPCLLLLYASLLLARVGSAGSWAGRALGLAMLPAPWCERGLCGGEAYSSDSGGGSGVTARIVVLVVVPVEVVMLVVKVAYSNSSRWALRSAVVWLLLRLEAAGRWSMLDAVQCSVQCV